MNLVDQPRGLFDPEVGGDLGEDIQRSFQAGDVVFPYLAEGLRALLPPPAETFAMPPLGAGRGWL